MAETVCPVHHTILNVTEIVASNRVSLPRHRRIVEEIIDLLNDIAWGRAGDEHLPAVESLVGELSFEEDQEGAKVVAGLIESALADHREIFESHIRTHNCSTGDCVRLAPAPCQMTCPAGLDIPTYVTLIGMGRDADAIDVIRRDCPFPWVCGLVCTRPCEFMCVRKRIDTPISIKFLKGFAAERAMSEGSYVNPEQAPDNGKKVCVVGAGPGGMSCAYYLALKGYRVRVLESQPSAGGMLLLGIPRYRLPREVIDREAAMLRELGVDFHFNTRFGEHLSMSDLQKEGFEAFFFAIGAHKSFTLGIPGENDCPQVIEAVDFLRDVALGHRDVPGERVVVIGGGNVAIDAARTSLRLGSKDVTIAYRRARTEMPADHEEVEQAEEEGVQFSFLTVPKEVVIDNDCLKGLECLRAKLIPIEGKNRMFPKPIEGSEYLIEADVIICAIGQRVDNDCMVSVPELDWTRRNTINVNMATMETSVEGVFAAGDAVTGPATVIEAIGGGKRAAQAIDRYLSGIPQPEMPPVPVRRSRVDYLEVPASTKMTIRRPEMPLLNIDRRRTTFQQVELGYEENQVREEARRCLRCDICLRCGKCVEICRDKMGVDALQMGYFDFDHPVETDFRRTQELCILCGACAQNCPTGAMHMEDQEGKRVLSLCGTVLNRQQLVLCDGCGAVLGPVRYLNFIRERTSTVAGGAGQRNLCETCARKSTARFSSETTPATKSK
ncbi:Molybdopterin oxidoreductase [Olavius algarvensis associated proteobacterium Delta 3]|nr:Molybdopterin oxidoreductase [Olavius algarvensis associated proteobacterium Delta 3]CAB5150376.1 Molybdopterin oxidoreductase [Olavius algarvensis associated proteobacterium Delta 3]